MIILYKTEKKNLKYNNLQEKSSNYIQRTIALCTIIYNCLGVFP